MAVTCDNASNNDTFFKSLARRMSLDPDCSMSDADSHKQVRCFAHITNLVVQDVLKHLSAGVLYENEDVDDKNITDTGVGAVVVKLRNLIIKIRASSQRRQEFRRIRNGIPKEPKLELIRDMPVRWNSTFLMIERAMKLKQVIIT
jgi:hypothetical protein